MRDLLPSVRKLEVTLVVGAHEDTENMKNSGIEMAQKNFDEIKENWNCIKHKANLNK